MASVINMPGCCVKCKQTTKRRNYMVFGCLKHLLCHDCVKKTGGLKDTKCVFCRFKRGHEGGHTFVKGNCSLEECAKGLIDRNFLGFECGIHQLCIPCAKQTESLDDEECPLCFIDDDNTTSSRTDRQNKPPSSTTTDNDDGNKLDDGNRFEDHERSDDRNRSENSDQQYSDSGSYTTDSSAPNTTPTDQGLGSYTTDSSAPNTTPTDQGLVRTPVLLPEAPTSLTYQNTVTMKDRYCSIWRCAQPDTVILGGERAPILTVLNARTGVSVTHRIGNVDQQRTVFSGLAIDTENHLINLATQRDTSAYYEGESVSSLHLDQTITTPQTLHTYNQLNVGQKPYCIFPIKTFRFGVYYTDSPVRAEVYGLRDIISKDKPGPVKTIPLGNHSASPADNLCVDAQDHILVLSYFGKCVSIYTQEGVCVGNIGTKRERDVTPEGGRLYTSISVQVYNNHRVVVTCDTGEVHLFNPGEGGYTTGTWELLQGKQVNRVVWTSKQIQGYHVVIDNNNTNKILFYKLSH